MAVNYSAKDEADGHPSGGVGVPGGGAVGGGSGGAVKTRKPDNTAFKQQRLPAWQPILTAGTVLPAFFIIGLIFIPIGIGIFVTSNNIREYEVRGRGHTGSSRRRCRGPAVCPGAAAAWRPPEADRGAPGRSSGVGAACPWAAAPPCETRRRLFLPALDVGGAAYVGAVVNGHLVLTAPVQFNVCAL